MIHHLRVAEYLQDCLNRLEMIRREKDLPGLHRLSNDLQTSLSETIVHENRPLFLDAFRVNQASDIESYAPRLEQRLIQLRDLYLRKARG